MIAGPVSFLLLNMALAFYNVGAIWAHEIDIFRSWRLASADNFGAIQTLHWRKLPYWIFAPVGAALAGGVLLIWNHPAKAPLWAIYGALICQLLSAILTALFWGRWQAKLAKDPLGPRGPYLEKILRTHWIRTLLINAYAAFLFVATVVAFGG